ncbi:carotenoid 1,2-hydratase, partial [Nocardiopsis lucentensis]|uniref:carotenoid 1,2-hydratase n=1 Tax=Nocardiopsis lucentensis TaxID=53441 RepID=UPI0013765E4C
MEWWWFNAHLEGDDGEFGLVFYFVRHRTLTPDGTTLDAHTVVWFRSDPAEATHTGESWMNESCAELVKSLAGNDRSIDPRVRRALTEALEQGRGFLPDRRLPGRVRIEPSRLDLDYGIARLRRDGDDYLVDADGAESGFSLRLTPLKPVTDQLFRHSATWPGRGAMRTYFVPRLAVAGSVRDGGRTESVTGDAWYERATGSPRYRFDAPPPT